MTENIIKKRYISPTDSEIYDIANELDKSFSERRKARRRAKLYDHEQKKEETLTKPNNQTEVYKPSQNEKERERFRKMGYVRRVKYLIDDVEELRKTSCENRKLIRELSNKIESLTGKVLKVKFNAQHLQKEVLKFVTYGTKEGYILIENGKFIGIEE